MTHMHFEVWHPYGPGSERICDGCQESVRDGEKCVTVPLMHEHGAVTLCMRCIREANQRLVQP